MGMSYYACANEGCGDGVCDHSHMVIYCSCDRVYCSERCADLKFKHLHVEDFEDLSKLVDKDEAQGDLFENLTCKYCRLDKAYSSELLDYVLEAFGLDKSAIEQEYLNKRREDGKTKEGREEG